MKIIKKSSYSTPRVWLGHHYHTTLFVIPGSTMELHVQVSDVSLTADTGDEWMTINFSPQAHHKGRSHVKNSNVEGSSIVSVIQIPPPPKKNRRCGLRFSHPSLIQGPWRWCDLCTKFKVKFKFFSFLWMRFGNTHIKPYFVIHPPVSATLRPEADVFNPVDSS